MGESSLPIEQTIDIEDLLAKVEESAQSQNGWLTIPKVPVTLRNILDFPKWIEPSVISIGPYYHDHDNLQEGEKLKPLWAKSNKEGGLNGSNFTNHHIAYIQQDLFLLENQLPFKSSNCCSRMHNFKIPTPWKN
ncbi:hypothetical protein CK203_027131 [Vitis vinifera]|uniref:Uncharacterized protein n=1 Tax=Vitis vinifera TaxID=29760 RepID=A0A438I6D4_VITVI|nr:hypothetical protein CK203_027131 [Vitis vinifera]